MSMINKTSLKILYRSLSSPTRTSTLNWNELTSACLLRPEGWQKLQNQNGLLIDHLKWVSNNRPNIIKMIMMARHNKLPKLQRVHNPFNFKAPAIPTGPKMKRRTKLWWRKRNLKESKISTGCLKRMKSNQGCRFWIGNKMKIH